MRHAAGIIAKRVPHSLPGRRPEKKKGGPQAPLWNSDGPEGQNDTRAPMRTESGSCQPLAFW